jgi:hypothetical protein
MVRDTQEGKARFDLMRPVGIPYSEQFMTRVAELMTRGIGKYGLRNWEKADSQEELDRFMGSAERHLHQYLAGETDEDHAAAVVFNLLAAESTRWKMKQKDADVAALILEEAEKYRQEVLDPEGQERREATAQDYAIQFTCGHTSATHHQSDVIACFERGLNPEGPNFAAYQGMTGVEKPPNYVGPDWVNAKQHRRYNPSTGKYE